MKLETSRMNQYLFLKNHIAYKILKLFGFSIFPNILAGESGGITYMVISAAKLEADDELTQKD